MVICPYCCALNSRPLLGDTGELGPESLRLGINAQIRPRYLRDFHADSLSSPLVLQYSTLLTPSSPFLIDYVGPGKSDCHYSSSLHLKPVFVSIEIFQELHLTPHLWPQPVAPTVRSLTPSFLVARGDSREAEPAAAQAKPTPAPWREAPPFKAASGNSHPEPEFETPAPARYLQLYS